MPNVNFEKVVRELWPQQRLVDETYPESPFYALIKKKNDFHEATRHINVKYGNPHNRNTNWTDAQTLAARDPKFGGFDIKVKEVFATGTLDGLTLEQTESSKAAQVNYINEKTSGTLQEMTNALCHTLTHDGSGVRGTIASVAGAVITLTEQADAFNFEVDQKVVVGTTITGAVRAGEQYIASIDPDGPTITLDAAIVGMAAGDKIFVWGDAQNGAGTKRLPSGIAAWNPFTAPAPAESFFGQDRSIHSDRLAGVRVTGSGEASVKVAILKLLTRMHMSGGKPGSKSTRDKKLQAKHIFVNPIDYESLLIDLQGQRDYMGVDVPNANVYFEALNFSTPYGRLPVHPCKYFDKGFARVIDVEHLTVHSLKEPVRIAKYDGLNSLRQANADGLQYQALSRLEIATEAPLYNGVVSLPS